MKIVLIGTAYPLRGGIAHYTGLLWKYLSRNHDVTVVTFSRQYPKFLFPGKTQEETGDPGIPLDSLQWIDSINPFSWIRTGLRLRKLNPDLVLYKFWMPFFAPAYGVIAAIARWRRRTKTMFICDNIIPHERRPGDRLLTTFAMHFVDSYVVQSRAVEADLKSWKRDPLYAYLPHPIYEIFGTETSREAAREHLNRKSEGFSLGPNDRVLLFFGYVRDYKGLDTLLEAMPCILDSTPAKLLVVGEFYNNERVFREQVKRLGIGNSVFFHSEYVPNEDVGTFFSAADVLTLPYKSATQSGIIQIAYNFNRPVIASDVGGLGEVVIDGVTGYIVPPEQPKALADAVCAFFEKNRFSDFRAAVLEERKKYSWEFMTSGIEDLHARSHENG